MQRRIDPPAGEFTSIPQRGDFESTQRVGKYCCNRFEDVVSSSFTFSTIFQSSNFEKNQLPDRLKSSNQGPRWLALSCATLFSSPRGLDPEPKPDVLKIDRINMQQWIQWQRSLKGEPPVESEPWWQFLKGVIDFTL